MVFSSGDSGRSEVAPAERCRNGNARAPWRWGKRYPSVRAGQVPALAAVRPVPGGGTPSQGPHQQPDVTASAALDTVAPQASARGR